jgi:hypothetical protein
MALWLLMESPNLPISSIYSPTLLLCLLLDRPLIFLNECRDVVLSVRLSGPWLLPCLAIQSSYGNCSSRCQYLITVLSFVPTHCRRVSLHCGCVLIQPAAGEYICR